MNDTGPAAELQHDEPWVTRHGWMLSAVWLVFVVFPLIALWDGDGDGSTGRKVGATALLLTFCAIYVIGFHYQHRVEQQAFFSPDRTGDMVPATGVWFLAALVVLLVAAYWLGGASVLGAVPFVVSFAVFNLEWVHALLVSAASLAVTIVVPLLDGTFDDLWFMSLIVLAVGGANILIRVFSSHEIEQSQLHTSLAISDERGRVARDVHDILGHSLTAVILKAELCQRLLEQVESADDTDQERIETCRHQLDELRLVSRSALAEIRSTVGGLRAANLTDELTVARTVLADGGVGLLVTGEPSDVPEAQRPILAWVVREAVTNIVRHARASSCHIELAPEPGRVWLRISDDGVGINGIGGAGGVDGSGNGDGPGTRVEGNGLRGLRERVETAGARLRVSSDGGTTLEVVR